MFFKRVAGLLALVFGIAGVAGCVAGAYGVWLVESRLEQANDKVFDAVDRSLGAVQDRIPIVQQRVKDSKITTTEVREAIVQWGTKKGRDRIESQLHIEGRAEKLAEQLQTIDLRLEASSDVVRGVRQMVELSQSLGANVDHTSMDAVQERLVSVQEKLQQADRAVDGIRKFAAAAEGDPMDHRVARILLTLSDVDQHLDDFSTRLSELRADARQAQAQTSRYILLGAIMCYTLLCWVAAGQAALSWWGWSCFRKGQ